MKASEMIRAGIIRTRRPHGGNSNGALLPVEGLKNFAVHGDFLERQAGRISDLLPGKAGEKDDIVNRIPGN